MLSDGELVAADRAEEILTALDDEVEKADKYNTRTISECVRQAYVFFSIDYSVSFFL